VSGALASLATGRVTLVESTAGSTSASADSLAAHVHGPAVTVAALASVRTAQSLAQALRGRSALGSGESLITREGEWVGRDWLRVSRGTDQRAGVLEREQRLKGQRAGAAAATTTVAQAEAALSAARAVLAQVERERDETQAALTSAHRSHADLEAAWQAGRLRAAESDERGERLQQDAGELARERSAAQQALLRAREELARAQAQLAQLESEHAALVGGREERRSALQAARAAAQAAQLAARDLHVRVESRRSTESSVAVGMGRMHEQHAQLTRRRGELEAELASGDEPIVQAQARLNETLALRLSVEGELAVARAALESTDDALRALDEERLSAEHRVHAARESMDAARLAAQETHVRRAALAEQFAETRADLASVLAGLAAEAGVLEWETALSEARAEIEKLGQVNLAAIDELTEHTQRKEYLDRQFADLNSALTTLEDAMRRIDKETRARFEDTFERINAGLREKFPRLFGGGHAYLELVGDDKLTAGVAVMARPPGKKNSTIHLLSGGEKALTAVALVFSIFDLNPAPFCLLDEVDAPLDEHNVGRFCDIVRDMATRVQFIFITHNKTTMELASQLIGVTMHEPGVSRLVTVDVDEAVRLAAV
jgi:chromosome segregation protein